MRRLWPSAFCLCLTLLVVLLALTPLIGMAGREPIRARHAPVSCADNLRGRRLTRHPCDHRLPIDAVYTWVNGSDPLFRLQLEQTVAGLGRQPMPRSVTLNRFDDNDELRFSLRSLEKFAPWTLRVFIVTNGQVPSWLDTQNPRVTVVPHSVIFPDRRPLPPADLAIMLSEPILC